MLGKSGMRKRLVKFLIVLAGLSALGTGIVLAASLNLSAGTLQSSNAAVSSCQTSQLTTSYMTTYKSAATDNVTNSGFYVTQVAVSNVDALACFGKTLMVQLAKSDGTALAGTKTVILSSNSQTSYNLAYTTGTSADNVLASDVGAVNAEITG